MIEFTLKSSISSHNLTLAQLQRLVISSDQLDQTAITLTAEQQHYLNRVLRLKSGDRFIAMNGQGQSWLVELQSNQATVIETVNTSSELTISVTLMLALPKGNAFDEVVRQVTELGVSCIVPVISDRTLLQPSANKLDRWRRIAQEAAEQSERQIVPTILDPTPFKAALETLTAEQKFFCAERGASPHLLHCLSEPKSSILVAIGCEGGWTNHEIDQAIAAGYRTVSLGKRILRAVTAPVVALSLIAAKAEES